jgi:hypothetical protein
VLSGCFGSSSTDDPNDPQRPASLRGATFQVTAATVGRKPRPLVDRTRVLIAFTQGGPEILGRAGCSLFFSNGIRITPSKIILPYRIHPVPGQPPRCSPSRRRQDAWVKAFLASDPRWELSPHRWKLGDEGSVHLTLTSDNTVVKLGQGKPQDLSGTPVSPDSGSPPVTK